LCISRKYENELKNQGYTVKYRHNFQGRAGWLTGWYIPITTDNISQITKWLCKAF
jgi:hypothetical protein